MTETRDVFLITEREASGEEPAKSIWTKIGVAFVNKDQSLNVMLDALPVHGRLHIRDRRSGKVSPNRVKSPGLFPDPIF